MEVLAQIQLSSLLFLAGLALVAGVLLFRVRRQANSVPDLPERTPTKKPKPGYAAPPPVAPNRGQERTLEHWEVQIHELARELIAQIETKTGVLQQFIRLADEQAARLESLLRQSAELGMAAPAGLAPVQPAANPIGWEGLEPAPLSEHSERVIELPTGLPVGQSPGVQFSEGLPPADANAAVAAAPPSWDEAPAGSPPSDDLPSSSSPRLDRTAELGRPHSRLAGSPRDAEDIYRLADYGLGAEEIAQQVRRPIGEIRLILALRERRPVR